MSNRTEFEPGAPFNDKNTMTADPYKRRFVYGAWQLLMDVLPDDDSAIPIQVFYSDSSFSFIGVFKAMSKDGGDTWSDHITVGGGDPTPDGFASFAQLPTVHVADDGTVGVLFFDDRNDVICPDLNLSNEDNPECFTVLPDGNVQAGPYDQDWYLKTTIARTWSSCAFPERRSATSNTP